MRRLGEASEITVKVRVMHAQVRRLIRASGRWQTALWGEPINQHAMVATALLFSVAVIDGLDKLAYRFAPAQRRTSSTSGATWPTSSASSRSSSRVLRRRRVGWPR